MKAKGLWITATAILVMMLGASVLIRTNTRRQEAEQSALARKRAAKKPVADEILATGRLDPQHVVPVAAPMEGTLVSLAVQPGEDVFEGQMIARIESAGMDLEREETFLAVERATAQVSDLQRQISTQRLEASRASAESARLSDETERLRKTYLRQQMLLREGATPRLVFEKAEREYQEAQKNQDAFRDVANRETERLTELTKELEQAQKRLNMQSEELEAVRQSQAAGQVFSPVNGVFLSSRVRTGESVNREMRDLFRFATDLQALQVQIGLDQSAGGRLRAGMSALIYIAEAGPDPISGTVTEVKPDAAVIHFANDNPAVRPGLMVQVRIPLT